MAEPLPKPLDEAPRDGWRFLFGFLQLLTLPFDLWNSSSQNQEVPVVLSTSSADPVETAAGVAGTRRSSVSEPRSKSPLNCQLGIM